MRGTSWTSRNAVRALGLGGAALLGATPAAGGTGPTADTVAVIIPRPASVRLTGGSFRLTPNTPILVPGGVAEAERIGRHFGAHAARATGFDVKVVSDAVTPATNVIRFRLDAAKKELGPEGYALRVTPREVSLLAAEPAGLFYGTQTLRQLLPADFESSSAVGGVAWTLPGVEIVDRPRFAWRGSVLDCARHFMSKGFVKRYIDLLAHHKLNVFHWHLVDDQGWRLEVRRYPRLTEVGAWRGSGETRHGGYYTQDDVREIVAYAAARFVTVVPEIELPGHSSAAIASYPELSCHGRAIAVPTEWGIKKDVYCAGKDEPFEFLEGVMEEVLELFPSEYIHIGGDEVPKEQWKDSALCQERIREEGLEDEDELQTWFIGRIQSFLAARGRKIIGWDDIQEGGVPPGALVQFWNRDHEDRLRGALDAGHDVISSLNSFAYFDYPEVRGEATPDWMVPISLERAYAFEPTAGLSPDQERLIRGAECAMWTEFAPQDRVDFQLYPRLAAFSEVVWTPRSERSFEGFLIRMDEHYRRLDKLGVRYNPMERRRRER